MNRNLLIVAALVVTSCLANNAWAAAPEAPSAGSGLLWVYIGTYTSGKSKGIYAARLDTATGALSSLTLAAATANPSFLAIHPTRPLLYAVGELGTFKGKKTGAVSAFAIDPDTGKLTLLGQQSSGGTGPCHVCVDRTGRCVLVANHGGGSVAALPVLDDGRLGEAGSLVQHQGSSVDPRRQQGPHAHGIYVDPANRFALVPDLGLDKVMIYRLDPGKAKLAANDPASVAIAPGSGPRHLAFHPNGRWAFVINELSSTLTSLRYDADRGALEVVETVSTLPQGFQGNNTTAEVQVHPSGRFVYGSNRGHDSIAIFAVDPEAGKLRLVGHQPTHGKTPRNFNLDPSGRWLLAAHQDSDNVVGFRVDAAGGKLAPSGQSLEVGKPVCVEFLRPGR